MASFVFSVPRIGLCLIVSSFSMQLAIAQRAAKTEECPYQSPVPTRVESKEISSLLSQIPLTAKWKDVSVATQKRLADLADLRLMEFRRDWGAAALSRKEKVLIQCPTLAMEENEDHYYQTAYRNIVPTSFSLRGIKNVALRDALVRNYLGSYAANRATVYYPDKIMPGTDWDGVSQFDSVRLPDPATYNAISSYNAKVRDELNSIRDDMLSYSEQQVKQYALYDARAHARGGFSGDGYGGFDMQSPCEAAQRDWDIDSGYSAEKGRPGMFKTDDSVLIEVNALFSDRMSLRWVDVGTVASATGYCNAIYPDDIKNDVGDPSSNEVAKALILMKSWWIDRLNLSNDSHNKCSIYTDADRNGIWDAFSADMHFNNDQSSSMLSENQQLEQFSKDKIASYHVLAKAALDHVFPDTSILSVGQRAKVDSAVDADDVIGNLFQTMPSKLDLAQGLKNGAAAQYWSTIAAEKVVRIGGYTDGESIRPEDKVLVEGMFEEVKTWIALRYKDYPIDIASLYPTITISLNTSNNASTGPPGVIKFGIGTKRSKYEYYSLLIHELRHAVAFAWQRTAKDRSKVQYDLGTAVEGAAATSEDMLLQPFAHNVLKDDTALLLNELDYGIRDARYLGTTDATLQKYLRPGCTSGADTVEFAKKIAERYGLADKLADNAAVRAHAGTQYFQYVLGGMQITGELKYLQNKIDPTKSHVVDPYVLFACGMNTPQRSPEYLLALKSCMKF